MLTGRAAAQLARVRSTRYNAARLWLSVKGVILSSKQKQKSTKKTSAESLKLRALGFLISSILRVVFFTSRKTYLGLQHLQERMAQDKSFILVSWHNRNVLACFGYLAHRPKHRRFFPLSSASKDGSIAVATMRWLGVICIRGSSSRGGTHALRAMLKEARAGHDLGITPDGPRGPRYQVQAGVITTAKLTGAPIIPMAYQARRKKLLNSWDRMIIPYPFNHLVYVYGPPIHVPRDTPDEKLEDYRKQVEEAMMACVAESDRATGTWPDSQAR